LAQGGSDTDPRFEKLAKDLYPKAKQEGALVVYTIWDIEHIKSILDVFNKRFPRHQYNVLARNPVRDHCPDAHGVSRRSKTADVILSEGAPVVLRAAGAIEPYNTVQANSLILHDPQLPTVSLQIVALAYNTKKLKKEDLPKSWEDVINPKYKGMVALDDPLRAGPLSGMLAGLKEYWKNDAKWTGYIKGLKALNVTVHKSTSAMFRLLIAGEYSISMPALLHDVIEEKEKGSPVDFVKSAAPIISAQQLGIYGKAPHINGAKPFTEWMMTPEGQLAVSAVGRGSIAQRRQVQGVHRIRVGANVKPIPSVNKTYSEDPRKWLDANVKPVWRK
jgi:ABC-type Fe3+ transport system substrate-binding protein